MLEEKIEIKAKRLFFFLVGHNFHISEDSLTVKYTESGLMYICINVKTQNMICMKCRKSHSFLCSKTSQVAAFTSILPKCFDISWISGSIPDCVLASTLRHFSIFCAIHMK